MWYEQIAPHKNKLTNNKWRSWSCRVLPSQNGLRVSAETGCMRVIHLPALWANCLSGSSHPLSPSLPLTVCVCPGNIGDEECPLQINGHYHDNHTMSWNGMMLTMATVAVSQANSPALPQGQAEVQTPGFDTSVLTLISISIRWQQLNIKTNSSRNCWNQSVSNAILLSTVLWWAQNCVYVVYQTSTTDSRKLDILGHKGIRFLDEIHSRLISVLIYSLQVI